MKLNLTVRCGKNNSVLGSVVLVNFRACNAKEVICRRPALAEKGWNAEGFRMDLAYGRGFGAAASIMALERMVGLFA